MSRVSLSRRLEAVLAAAERVNPQAAAVYRLSPALRVRYTAWRAECDRAADRYPDGSALYEAFLAGEYRTPQMPQPLREALHLQPEPVLPASMSERAVADLWADMIAG